jgi:hypothetical protein
MGKEGIGQRLRKIAHSVFEGDQPEAQAIIDRTIEAHVRGEVSVHNGKTFFQTVADRAVQEGGEFIPDRFGGVYRAPGEASYGVNDGGKVRVIDLRGAKSGKEAMRIINELHTNRR